MALTLSVQDISRSALAPVLLDFEETDANAFRLILRHAFKSECHLPQTILPFV
jgi:hypothetical protein